MPRIQQQVDFGAYTKMICWRRYFESRCTTELVEETMKKNAAGFALVLALFVPTLAPGQPQDQSAPVPAPILSAKRVFVANAGGECGLPEESIFKGLPNRAYQQFYSALTSWQKYELVANPSDADLVLEISLSCPPAGPKVFEGQSFGASFQPQLKLVIFDTKSHAELWVITGLIPTAKLQSNRDKNFDKSMEKLVNDFKQLAAGKIL